MKKKLFVTSLILTTSLSACVKNGVNDNKNLDNKDIESVESAENKDISLDTYNTFYSEGQFKLTIVNASIKKFEEINDISIKDNIEEAAEGKYVVFLDYIFEDLTIDSDFSMSSYKMADLMPEANTVAGDRQFQLISATNIVPDIENLKANEESIRAIFVSDEKINQVNFNFHIKDKLERQNVYSAVIALD